VWVVVLWFGLLVVVGVVWVLFGLGGWVGVAIRVEGDSLPSSKGVL
jgi:hypothetical protein